MFPYDPTRNDPRWLEFNQRFEDRFHEKPEQFASLAYDAMNALLDSICKAGLNRARIHDALADIEEYDGVTGHMVFDPNQKNVAPMYLGTVHNGAITYRVATMEKQQADSRRSALPGPGRLPYARVGEDGVSYAGPSSAGCARGSAQLGALRAGRHQVAQSEAMQKRWLPRRAGAPGSCCRWTAIQLAAADRKMGPGPTRWCMRYGTIMPWQ